MCICVCVLMIDIVETLLLDTVKGETLSRGVQLWCLYHIMISSVLYESLLHSTVAIFELFPSTSEVNEANGPASVFVRLAAGSGELTYDIAVTIETIAGGTATGKFISKL